MKLPGKRGKDASSTATRGLADTQAQSEEALRVRARRRLIGAVALVLTGVVVFPLIFETQPKPVASNMTLVIPSQNQPGILPAPAASIPAAQAKAAAAVAVSSPKAASTPQGATPRSYPASAATGQQAPVAAQPQPAATPAEQVPAQAQAVAPQPQQPAEAMQGAAKGAAPAAHGKPQPSQHQIASARQALAALEGKHPDQISTSQAEAALAKSGSSSSSARYVIQAGAFADTKSAHEVRQKIEHAGFKTYTQVVDTDAGKRIRVRVGPFSSREQADKALARIRALGLKAVVLTL